MRHFVSTLLQRHSVSGRFFRFGIIGLSGIFVNSSILWFLHHRLGFPLWLSPIFAILGAIFYNFNLNNFFTWNDATYSRKFNYTNRLWRYYLSAALGAILNYIILIGLTNVVHMHYLYANIIGILAGTLSNFILSDRWVFKKQE